MAPARKTYSDDDRRKNGQFGTGYTKEMLYALVEAVIKAVDPVDPASVSQPAFDREAPAIAAANEWPKPPTARAISMRLGEGWPEVKEKALSGLDIEMVVAKAEGAELAPWLDERHLFFALRRVVMHLEQETLVPHEYERGRLEVIQTTKRFNPDSNIDELLPTRGQILLLVEGDWPVALQIAQLSVPEPKRYRGFDIVKIAEHFYETEERLPTAKRELEEHARRWNVRYPDVDATNVPLEEIIDELIADRAKRQLPTPDSGPVDGARLGTEEIAALIAGAVDLPRPRGYWTEERVVEAFADFVDLFEGKAKLTSALFKAHRKEHRWPNDRAIQNQVSSRSLSRRGGSGRRLGGRRPPRARHLSARLVP